MAKRIYPQKGTHADRLLRAMLTRTMHLHPEFLQREGQPTMVASIKGLREGNIPVQTRVIAMPIREDLEHQTIECFLSDEVCEAILEEGYDD